jgi:molybdopterin-containing oxidoreductase family iron-sulfur binding subunit
MFFSTAMVVGGKSRPGSSSKAMKGGRRRSKAIRPSRHGAADVFAQAAILGLYDPDRSKTLTNVGEIPSLVGVPGPFGPRWYRSSR